MEDIKLKLKDDAKKLLYKARSLWQKERDTRFRDFKDANVDLDSQKQIKALEDKFNTFLEDSPQKAQVQHELDALRQEEAKNILKINKEILILDIEYAKKEKDSLLSWKDQSEDDALTFINKSIEKIEKKINRFEKRLAEQAMKDERVVIGRLDSNKKDKEIRKRRREENRKKDEEIKKKTHPQSPQILKYHWKWWENALWYLVFVVTILLLLIFFMGMIDKWSVALYLFVVPPFLGIIMMIKMKLYEKVSQEERVTSPKRTSQEKVSQEESSTHEVLTV
ncbi:MAG: hypothetical protein GXP45_06580 [bacterium]|nr:hypothetical protein [bacterium]